MPVIILKLRSPTRCVMCMQINEAALPLRIEEELIKNTIYIDEHVKKVPFLYLKFNFYIFFY